MKKLSEMLETVQRLNKDPMFAIGERHEEPLYDNFGEMLCEYSDMFDPLMVKGKQGELELTRQGFSILMIAYAFGAASGLGILKEGLIIRDGEGNAVDRAYYSLPELLAEAQTLLSPPEALEEVTLEMAEVRSSEVEEEIPEEEGNEYEHGPDIGVENTYH